MSKTLLSEGRRLTANNFDRLREVTLRLSDKTCKNRPGFEILACYGRGQKTRKDRSLETSTIERLGYFDSTVNADGKRICLLNIAKIRRYMSQGCHTTEPVWRLLGMSGAFPVHPEVYVQAAKHQYIHQICPPVPAESVQKRAEVLEVTMEEPMSQEYDMDQSDQDYRNHVRGEGVKIGDFSQMNRFFKKLAEQEGPLNHIEKTELQALYVKTYWQHNHYFDAGGEISNFNMDRLQAQESADVERERQWYKRRVRKTHIPDPFLFSQKKTLRRDESKLN